jgi:hypothetical protein
MLLFSNWCIYPNFFGQHARDASGAFDSNFMGQFAGYQATRAFESNFFGSGAGQGATNAYQSNLLVLTLYNLQQMLLIQISLDNKLVMRNRCYLFKFLWFYRWVMTLNSQISLV